MYINNTKLDLHSRTHIETQAHTYTETHAACTVGRRRASETHTNTYSYREQRRRHHRRSRQSRAQRITAAASASAAATGAQHCGAAQGFHWSSSSPAQTAILRHTHKQTHNISLPMSFRFDRRLEIKSRVYFDPICVHVKTTTNFTATNTQSQVH